jgi:hypothetical protein
MPIGAFSFAFLAENMPDGFKRLDLGVMCSMDASPAATNTVAMKRI